MVLQETRGFRQVPTFASAYRDLFKDTLIRLPDREAIKAYESHELNFIGRPLELKNDMDNLVAKEQQADLVQQQTAIATGKPLHENLADNPAPAKRQWGGPAAAPAAAPAARAISYKPPSRKPGAPPRERPSHCWCPRDE